MFFELKKEGRFCLAVYWTTLQATRFTFNQKCPDTCKYSTIVYCNVLFASYMIRYDFVQDVEWNWTILGVRISPIVSVGTCRTSIDLLCVLIRSNFSCKIFNVLLKLAFQARVAKGIWSIFSTSLNCHPFDINHSHVDMRIDISQIIPSVTVCWELSTTRINRGARVIETLLNMDPRH